MGTGSSSKNINEEDVRNRLNSGDFQKVSPPSSPSIEAKKDEMSYSGILVEKPEVPMSPAATTTSTMSASFAADLKTPPVSNRSKNRTKSVATTSNEQPRRIVKATPPSAKVVASMDDNRNDDESEDLGGHQAPALASPIGAKAASEMLEESIEKNDPKNKLLERVTNKQKNDREKLLQEKRRQQPGNDSKPKVEANPFSRFLSAFSVDANPTHKRKESIDAGGDPNNKRLKYGFNDASSNTKSETSSSDETENEDDTGPNFSSWIPAAAVATLAVLVFAIVRGSKKK